MAVLCVKCALILAIFVMTPILAKSEWERTIQDILKLQDPKIPPDFEKDYATVVTVQLYIVSFDSISESTMDYSISVFLRQAWTDQRMNYTELPGLEMLELDTKVMEQVWVPDLFFTNEKKASFHQVTVPNKLMHVYPDGSILYSARISMTLSCDMYLEKFPFDSQVCSVIMESYSYSTKNVIFKWHDTPLIQRENLNLPQFEFVDTTYVDCTKEFTGIGNYTCIRADFHLSRSFGYYVAQVYIPSVLIVSLSWVSFWLDIEAVPARISLGLLTVLTMTTQSSNSRSNLPRVSYIKAIDVWMAMCLFFVFAALIEFAYVNVHSRVEKRRVTQAMGSSQPQGGLKLGVCAKNGQKEMSDPEDSETKAGRELLDPEDSESKPKRLFSKSTIDRAKARRLDKISRYFFPGVFIAFNIFYWMFYMLWEPQHLHQ